MGELSPMPVTSSESASVFSVPVCAASGEIEPSMTKRSTITGRFSNGFGIAEAAGEKQPHDHSRLMDGSPDPQTWKPQGKGSCLSHEGSGNTRQRQCLSHEGSGTHEAKAVSKPRRQWNTVRNLKTLQQFWWSSNVEAHWMRGAYRCHVAGEDAGLEVGVDVIAAAVRAEVALHGEGDGNCRAHNPR